MKGFLVISVLFCVQLLSAQFDFKAEPNKEKLAVNDTLIISFVMNDDADDFKAPDFSGFKVVGGPYQMVSQKWTDGKRTFSKTYRYKLLTLQEGSFTIAEASVLKDGNLHKTQPVKIDVVASLSKENPGPELFIKAEPSAQKIRMGDTLMVKYRLYLASHVGVSSFKNKEDFPGFDSTIEPMEKLVLNKTEIDGKEYRSAVIKTLRLAPKKPGTVALKAQKFGFDGQFASGKKDFFGRAITKDAKIEILSDSPEIIIEP